MRKQAERIARGYVELPAPARECLFVVGKQAPQKGVDGGVRMLAADQWHRQRQGNRIRAPPPRVVVYETQSPGAVALYDAHRRAVEAGEQARRCHRGRRAALTMASISGPGASATPAT